MYRGALSKGMSLAIRCAVTFRAAVGRRGRIANRGAMATLSIYGRSIELTNLSRMMYPGEDVMTGDVLHYYYRIADTIMPHIRGRMLSMQRFPDGVLRPERCETGVPEPLPEWVRTCEVAAPGAFERASQVIVDEPATLVYMAQHACITPYQWLSRASAPSLPDLMVFDLDPAGPGQRELEETCRAAQLLRDVLLTLGLTPFVMTTGSRGLHVRVPIRPQHEHDVVAGLAAEVTARVVGLDPHRLSASPLEHEREGKVLIDHTRNAFGRTVVAPYALRALPGAPVATPLAWDELGAPRCGPRDQTMSSIFPRLAREGDPWKRMASASAPLPLLGDDPARATTSREAATSAA